MLPDALYNCLKKQLINIKTYFYYIYSYVHFLLNNGIIFDNSK